MEAFNNKLSDNIIIGLNILNDNKPIEIGKYGNFKAVRNSITFGTNEWVGTETENGLKLLDMGWYMYNGDWNFNIYSENTVPLHSNLSKLMK